MKIGVIIAAAALTAVPAGAQYRDDPAPPGLFRDGQPEVLRPPPSPLAPGVLAAGDFRAAYARARSPRIMVFWNRTFSDELTTAYRDNLHGEATHAVGFGDGVAVSRDTVDVSTGTTRVDTWRDAAMGEDVEFAVEAAFTDSLAANGARLIDRSMAMRASGRGTGSRPNLQAAEAAGAAARADLLIEVLQTASAGTPTGAAFKVTVKDIHSARVLAAFASGGSAPARPAGYVVGPGGFVRDTRVTTTPPDGVGRELAGRTMAALARSLR
ncbi:MAG: hypothetical protein H7243_00645 [Sphingomonadaceae bacterium]|nr:hypothetical protein [Sphingomonadaceae bacterium]